MGALPVPDLTGARLKLGRAEYHLDAFACLVREHLEVQPYGLRVEPDPDGPHHLVRAQIRHQPPPLLGLVAGEVAHQARSCLDLALYHLSDASPADRRHLQFPIGTSLQGYRRADQRGMLVGVGPRHRAVVERHQPYERIPSAPGRDPLAILADLNNTDKHRVLPTVGAAVQVSCVPVRAKPGTTAIVRKPIPGGVITVRFGPGVVFNASATADVRTVIDIAGLRVEPLHGGVIAEDGAPVARLTLPPSANVQVQPQATFAIQFGPGCALAEGLDALACLRAIIDRVEEVVADLESA